MEFEDVLYRKRDGRAIVTINRPGKRNALRFQTVRELLQAFEEAESDPHIGVVVLTGAGDDAFCAGGDLHDVGTLTVSDASIFFNIFMKMLLTVRSMPKPVIAAINGHCIGGGHELNLVCDLAIASENASFRDGASRVGSTGIMGPAQLLPMLIGDRRAREVIFLSRTYTAHDAERMGWINRVVKREDLMVEVDAWCDELLHMGPQSIAIAKTYCNSTSVWMWASLAEASRAMSLITASPEWRKGMSAFMEKRPPDFSKLASQVQL